MTSFRGLESSVFQQLADLVTRDSVNYEKAGWVLGSAKSVVEIRKYDNSGIKIGIGDLPWRDPSLVPFYYWITANSIYPVPWNSAHFRQLIKSNTKVLISSVSAESSQFKLNNAQISLQQLNISTDLTVYDVRHFGGKPCQPERNCCKFASTFIKSKSIQELINEPNHSSVPLYSTGSTVALHGYALAVLLRCNPIFLCGIEIPTVQKNYSYHKNWKMPDETFPNKFRRLIYNLYKGKRFTPSPFAGETFNQIISDFQAIAGFANDIGIDTFVTSKSSSLNLVDGITFKSN
jgi:hypothetical protein